MLPISETRQPATAGWVHSIPSDLRSFLFDHPVCLILVLYAAFQLVAVWFLRGDRLAAVAVWILLLEIPVWLPALLLLVPGSVILVGFAGSFFCSSP